MEDVALWHERDISHSSAERMILPDACAISAYTLRIAARVVRGLRVNVARMEANVARDGGIVFSQRVLTALVSEAGWPRERAYRAVQALALRARDGEGGFRQLATADPDVSGALNAVTLDRCFDLQEYLRGIDVTYRRLGIPIEVAPRAPERETHELAVEAGVGGGRV